MISEAGTTHGRLAFPCDHPLYAQGLPLWSPEVRKRLDEFDVLLVVGMDLLRQYVYHEPARAIPEHIRLVHLDEDPYQLGKNYPVEVGLIGDAKTGLAELDGVLDAADDAGSQTGRGQRSRSETGGRQPRAIARAARGMRGRARSAADVARGVHGSGCPGIPAGCGRGRRSRDDDQHHVRTAGRAEEHVRLLWASRLGAGLGTGRCASA